MTNEELLHAYRNGDKSARDMLIQQNIGLVHKYAKLYVGKFEYDDLVQEGSIGLMKAVDKYIHASGVKFSSFAGKMVKWAMYRFMAAQSCAEKGISYGDVEKIRKLKYHISDLSYRLCKRPSIKEIALCTRITAGEVERLLLIMQEVKSIDTPVDTDGEDITLADCLADDNMLPDESVYLYELKKILRNEIERLSDKEKYIIKARYGF